jgi:hypothetical protein
VGQCDFHRYLTPVPGWQGFFTPLQFENVIVVNTDAPFDIVATTILHEYTHFIQRNTSTMNFPPWYLEGYAELLSSASLERDRLVLGKTPNGLHVDMSRWIPVERILAVKKSDPEYLTERLAPEFCAESWALVHLLVFDDKALLDPTSRYLHALHKGYPEADAQFARFVFMLGRPKEVVLPLATAALKESPTNLAVRALFARIAVSKGEPFDLADRRRTKPRVLSILQLASYRAPHNASLLRYMASAYEAMGDKPKARDCYNQSILVSSNPAERLWAQRQADSQRLQDSR